MSEINLIKLQKQAKKRQTFDKIDILTDFLKKITYADTPQ